MKKKISRIWGVGLILMMVVSLLMWTAPVSAGNTLQWDSEGIPDADDWVVLAGEDIVALGVSAGGLVIYAGVGDATIYVSTDQGVTWDDSGSPTVNVDFIAVAPDDPRYVVITDGTDVEVSDDGGATWEQLGSTGLTPTTVECLAVSQEVDDSRWIAVGGYSAGPVAEACYYEIGAIGAAWIDLSGIGAGFTGANITGALAFSPNFHSDEIMTAVTYTNADAVYFEMFSYNQDDWNSTAGFDDFPVKIIDDTDADQSVDGLDAASVALSPDYLGSDDDMRIAFVGITTLAGSANEDEGDGIFRLENDDVDTLEDETNINSIAFDGTLLVAGGYDDTEVYTSSDPLASTPDVDDTASNKAPGGEEQCIVGIAGDRVVAATYGDEGGFSISRNNGESFNDISLLDVELVYDPDVAVSPDGSMVYLVTLDDSDYDLSVWRMSEDQDADWERILSVQNRSNDTYMVCLAPDDPDTVVIAEKWGNDIYYSSDAGESRWRIRASRYDIYHLAVEGTGEVLYVVVDDPNACLVSKSTNAGFTWGSSETTGISDEPNMIRSLGEDLIIVGSDDGYVAYSTDGNESWTDLDQMMDNDVVVTATGLSDGDFIFAGTDEENDFIYRWQIGVDDEWDDFYDMEDPYECTGIAYVCGTLYVMAVDDDDPYNSRLYRSLNPMDDDPDFDMAGETGYALDIDLDDWTGSSFAVSSTGGSVKLWAAGGYVYNGEDPVLYSYEDTINKAAPALKSPAQGFVNPLNEISGDTADVTFTWESPSDEITYWNLEVALDEGFDEKVIDMTVGDNTTVDEGDIVSETITDAEYDFLPGITYFWKVKATDPARSPFSEKRSFSVEEAEAAPPVEVEVPPAPEVIVEMPAPEVTVTVPPVVTVPPAPAPVTPAFIWGIIVLGAILVVALIVLILRTRRVV